MESSLVPKVQRVPENKCEEQHYRHDPPETLSRRESVEPISSAATCSKFAANELIVVELVITELKAVISFGSEPF